MRRRSHTVGQKRRLLEAAARPRESITPVGRRYGNCASGMFTWTRAMKEAGDEGLKGGE
ncbi:MAG: hypothetical protein ACO3JL_03405 [Myxococcota bacterium]